MFANFFMKFDFYSDYIKFTYKQHRRIKTSFGGIVSCLIIILSVTVFGYFSVDLYAKKKPESRLSQELKNVSEINIKEFPIVIAVVSRDGKSIEDAFSYITLYATFFALDNVNGNTTASYKRGFFEKCDLDVHFANHKDLFSDPTRYVSMSNEVCLNPTKSLEQIEYKVDGDKINNSDSLYFYNEYTFVPSIFLDIEFLKCDEKRDKKQCGSEENFRKLFKEFYVLVNTVDYFIDLQDFKNPQKKKLLMTSQMLGLDISKRNFFRYKNSKIITDDGFFIENNNEVNFFQFTNIKFDLYKSDTSLYEITFEVLQISDVFYRKYDKIQDILAKIGGIIKVVTIFGQFIISFYSERFFYCDAANLLFEKEVNPKAKGRIDSFQFPLSVNNFKVQINSEVIVSSMYKVRKPLDLSISDYAKSKICPKRAKNPDKIYTISKNYIDQYLQFENYIRKFRNIDQLIDLVTINNVEKDLFDCKFDLENGKIKDEPLELFANIKNNLRKDIVVHNK